MISALMGIGFVVGLGMITYGWFLRFFGFACMVVGGTFTLVQIATEDHDSVGYVSFGLLLTFGFAFWVGGHLWHWKVRGFFRSPLGKSVCVALAYALDFITRRGRWAPSERVVVGDGSDRVGAA